MPTFFVVGAPTAGTTSLYHYLRQHPAVYMSPIKEPCFFAPEVAEYPGVRRELEAGALALRAYLDGAMREPRSGVVLDWEQYLKLFKLVGQERAVGEASTSYLSSPRAARAISEVVPHARIVMLLRDPADRLFSNYSVKRAEGRTSLPFGSWAQSESAREVSTGRVGHVCEGRYARNLRRFAQFFPQEQLLICLYDDFARDAAAVLRSVFSHLDVDPDYQVDTSHRHNERLVQRWPALDGPLTRSLRRVGRALLPAGVRASARRRSLGPARDRADASDRKRVIAMYARDIEDLQTLIERDLSAWLDPNRSDNPRPTRQT